MDSKPEGRVSEDLEQELGTARARFSSSLDFKDTSVPATSSSSSSSSSRSREEEDEGKGEGASSSVSSAKEEGAKGTTRRRSSAKRSDRGVTVTEDSQEKSSRIGNGADGDDKEEEEEEEEENMGKIQHNATVIPSRTVSITSSTVNPFPSRTAQRKDPSVYVGETDSLYESNSRRPSRQALEADQRQAEIDSFGSGYNHTTVQSMSSTRHNDSAAGREWSRAGDVGNTNAHSREKGDSHNPQESATNSTNKLSPEQLEYSRNFLMRPCSRDSRPMLCYVERDHSGFNFISPVYRLYIEPSNSGIHSLPTAAAFHNQASAYPVVEGSRFVMSAKKKLGSKTSYYLVSMDYTPDIEDRGSKAVLGKIRGDRVGSQYIFTDHGMAPAASALPSMLRKELGLTRFKFDSGGPSQIDAWIPMVNSSGSSAVVWQPTDPMEGTIEATVKTASSSSSSSSASSSSSSLQPRMDRLMKLCNKMPKWDASHGGHVLNFHGRVTESSVKNFQLCSSETGDDIVLQFGRVGKHRFSMDVSYPLSPFQAFSLCVACMDRKLADRQGYDMFRRLTKK